MGYVIKAVGDQAVLVVLGNDICRRVHQKVMALDGRIQESVQAGWGIVETVPAFTSLLIRYNPLATDPERIFVLVSELMKRQEESAKTSGRFVEIPVCYGGTYGADLPFVAAHAGLSEKEVIDIHCARDYLIYMLGFLPGFPYLGGLDQRIATPRLDNPRTCIPGGSVGIGGEQTGIYPVDSPGGWQLIGRTPLRLFDPEGESLYKAGDTIRFVPIEEKEYDEIKRQQEMR